jgi:hypothetical protein
VKKQLQPQDHRMNLERLAPFCSAIKFGLVGAHAQATKEYNLKSVSQFGFFGALWSPTNSKALQGLFQVRKNLNSVVNVSFTFK